MSRNYNPPNEFVLLAAGDAQGGPIMMRLESRREPDSPSTCMVKRSILVVEDEEDIRELVSYTLLKEGYQVASVASGEEALSVAEAKPPDLIVLDLMLPGLDGLTVCQRLRANPKTAGTAIVMLTARGEEADIVGGLNMGADDYITKPFSRNVLLARIRAVLRNAALAHGSEARSRKRRWLDPDPQHRDPSGAPRSDGGQPAGGAERHGVPPVAFPGAQTRLGLLARADSRCRAWRQLRGHGTGGGRADCRSAAASWHGRQAHRDGPRRRLPSQGMSHGQEPAVRAGVSGESCHHGDSGADDRCLRRVSIAAVVPAADSQ